MSLLRGVFGAINIIVIVIVIVFLSVFSFGWLQNTQNPLSACLSVCVGCVVMYSSMKQTRTEFMVKGVRPIR